MNETKDLLQIKIEEAKQKLPEQALEAISAIDWRAPIINLRESKGYTFEQLGDLEVETELVLCGLLAPADYPKELEKQMGISKAEAAELVNEMNNLVFRKIKQEMIKITERTKTFTRDSRIPRNPSNIRIEMLPASQEIKVTPRSILEDKFSGSFAIEPKKTEYSLTNISKVNVLSEKRIAPVDLSVPQAPNSLPKPPSVSAAKVMADIKPAQTSEVATSPSYNKSRDPYRLSPEE